MCNKCLLAVAIGGAIINTAVAQEDEHLIIEGREFGYKADHNSTALRMDMLQLETPGQISIIDSAVIEEQRASTLGEVLKNDASISAGGQGRNRERFSLRGFELGSSDGFLRDGRQHWSHYRQPIELLERVEVLKGPSGLLYGKSEPGGLVNMISKKPTSMTQAYFSQDIGSNDHSRTVLDVGGALNDAESLRARTILAQENYGSWRQYGDGTEPDTDRSIGGFVVEYDVTENIMLSAHYDRTKEVGSVDSGAYIVDEKPVIDENYIWDAQWSKIDNDVENYGVEIHAQVMDNMNVKASYNRQDFKRFDVESYPSFEEYEQTGQIKHKGNERSDHWVFDTAYLDITTDFSLFETSNSLLIGVNYLDYNYDRSMAFYDAEFVPAGETVAKPNSVNSVKRSTSQYDTWGLYAQNMLTLSDKWQVLAGVRYDEKRSDKLTEQQVSPKLGLIFHPASNGSIYVQYSESFMPQGSVNDPDFSNDGQELEAERGISYEIGTKWELLDERLYLTGALFDITLENVRLDIDDPSNPNKEIATQDGEQVHKGAEFLIQGAITDTISLNASAMYLDAEITASKIYQGHQPVDVPEWSASVWTNYEVQPNTNINLGMIYEGDRYGDAANTFKKEAYTRFDIGFSHTFRYDDSLDIIARFNIENLFDEDYLAGGGTTKKNQEGASGVVIGEGRNYMASLQFKY
ncbi:TonB-dependent siderophore receptor [Vibrio sagamiensis]|uniref:Ligand-gated channel protein n=1 Tax=Vibrio sagamiensis NBRC 104589 TaxID=1219064 RepID=A0A511QJB6_9VIBR|nr:TonB-dependent siderophore receptor [Vibrio sagamiensis]PNQ63017.1 TonB-dependent siderophore receptor [Vibrio agarivorans]GEM77414.1 ligand-gated channel protein [Vibrio sagamiensis NBRC 104589]